MKYLDEKIVGLKVVSVNDLGKVISFQFDNGSTFSINNPFSFIGSDLKELISTKVDHLEFDSNQLSVIFSNGSILKIGLREEDYINGPEAFVFTLLGGSIMVQRLGDD